MTKKRVVIARSNGVNPDSRVEKEADALAKAGFEVVVVAWNRDRNYRIREDVLKLPDAEVKRVSFGIKAGFGLGKKILKQYLLFQFRLFAWLVRNRKSYDIVHLCDFDTAFFGSWAARICRKKTVFDVFDYLSTDARTFFRRLVKKAEDGLIDDADAVIICTEERKKQIAGTKPKRLEVIHNTPPPFAPSKRDEGGERVKIAYVGILQDHRLLAEMVGAVEKMDDVELHIGGFGKYEDYVESRAKASPNIFYYGKLPYEKTLELEARCDVMTAIYDPAIGNHRFAAPNKFYEALMLGKPLVMARGTGMSEVVEAENLGVLIDYGAEGFAKGVAELIRNRDQWEKTGERMKKLYKERYSWEEMERRLVALYEEVATA